MKILGVIPARGGSKGIPSKNIKLLGGKPLIQFTTEVALKSKFLDKVIVSSDDDEIIKVGNELGIDVPFKRPLSLSEDDSPTLPVLKHALNYFQSQGEFFDAVCLLQPTSPFRSVDFLDKAIETFIKKGADSLISVLEVPHEYNPHWIYEKSKDGTLYISTGEKNIITRRQELPKAYHRDGSIYLTKASVILEQNSLFGESISYIISDKKLYVNIDTLEDWKKAEDILNRNYGFK